MQRSAAVVVIIVALLGMATSGYAAPGVSHVDLL